MTYNVYKKDVKSGGTVTLGELNMSNTVNYVAMAKPYDPNETYTNPIEFIWGDINGDETTDVFDMILMRRALTEPLTDKRQILAADTNSDGEINSSDAVLLQKFLLGAK